MSAYPTDDLPDFSPQAANRSYARRQARSRGLDPDFVDKLFTRESGYNSNARNPESGAAGIGQDIPGTAQRYKITDPYDAKQNIDGNLDYLTDLHKRFNGDQRKVAAGYFAGEGSAQRALANPRGNPKTKAYADAVAGPAQDDDLPDFSAPRETSAPNPAPVASFNIDQSAFSDRPTAAKSAQFDFASKFPTRTPAQRVTDRVTQRKLSPRPGSTAFNVPPASLLGVGQPQGDPTKFPEVVIAPQSPEGRAYANEAERRKKLSWLGRAKENVADVVMGTNEDGSRMGFLESQRRGLESVAGAATRLAGEAGGLGAIPIEAAGRAIGSPALEHSGDLSREMQIAAKAEQQRNPGVIPELARAGTDIALTLPALSAKIPALAMGALSTGRALGRGASPTEALGEGLIAAGPLFVLQGSPLGGMARKLVTRALAPEVSAEMASEASTAARLTRYQKLQALASDASTTDAERALAASRARAVADTLNETSQAEIDKAVAGLKQHLVANVAGLTAQGATNAAQFIGTSAALELGIKGKAMTADEIFKQSLLLLAFEATPVAGALGEARGQVRDLRSAEGARRSLDLKPRAGQPIGEARQLAESAGESGAPTGPPETPTGPRSTIHTPPGQALDPNIVATEVQNEIAARSGVVPGVVRPSGSPAPEMAPGAQTRLEAPGATIPSEAPTMGTPGEGVQATIPEPRQALLAQLDALRAKRGNRRAVLVTPGEQMPASRSSLENQGIAVTKAVDASGQPVGTFIHDPREVSRQTVRQMAADGTFQRLLGTIEPKSGTTTAAVIAKAPEGGTEIDTKLASPENVQAQVDELRAQHPGTEIAIESPTDVIAGRRAPEPPQRAEIPIEAAAHAASTSPLNRQPEPTPAQIEAGNYKKGHVTVGGLDISIENPEGSKRKPEWPTLKSHYGYIKRTEGGDGEHVDVFVKPDTPKNYTGPVFVVDQHKASGAFDEHKVMLGWPDEAAARAGYLENYTPGWKVGPIRGFANTDKFRDWLKTADTTKPATGREQADARTREIHAETGPPSEPHRGVGDRAGQVAGRSEADRVRHAEQATRPETRPAPEREAGPAAAKTEPEILKRAIAGPGKPEHARWHRAVSQVGAGDVSPAALAELRTATTALGLGDEVAARVETLATKQASKAPTDENLAGFLAQTRRRPQSKAKRSILRQDFGDAIYDAARTRGLIDHTAHASPVAMVTKKGREFAKLGEFKLKPEVVIKQTAPPQKQVSNDRGIMAAIRSRGGVTPGNDIANYFSNKESGSTGLVVSKAKGGRDPEDMLNSLVEDGWFRDERGPLGQTSAVEVHNRGERSASDIILDAMRKEQTSGKLARPSDYDYGDEIDREMALGPLVGFVNQEDADILYRKALKDPEWSDLFYKVVDESEEPTIQDAKRFRTASAAFGISDDATEAILASGEAGRSPEATDFAFGEEADLPPIERDAASGLAQSAGEQPEDVDYQHYDAAIREPSADYKSLSPDDYQRVVAKLDSLKAEAKDQGRPLSSVIDRYMKQGDLFSGHELSDDQRALLRQLAERGKRAALHAEQSSLFDAKPTVESRLEQRRGEDVGGGFGGGGSLFEPKAEYGKQTETPEFKKFFKGSQVTRDGEPLVVYHGTLEPFNTFMTGEGNKLEGVFFTDNKEDAAKWATRSGGLKFGDPAGRDDVRIVDAYVRIRKPADEEIVDDAIASLEQRGRDSSPSAVTEYLIRKGYDGYIDSFPGEYTQEIVAFRPEQIKSATGNRGTFDPKDPNILKEPGAKYGDSQRIGIFKGDKLVGTASLSQDTNPDEWVKANYGPSYDHGPLTMENESEPITVYHGTNADIGQLDPANAGAIKGATFYTDSPKEAGKFTGIQYGERVGKGANVIKTTVRFENPKTYDFGGKLFDFKKVQSFVVRAKADGNDGVIIKNIRNFPDSEPTTTYVDLSPRRLTEGKDIAERKNNYANQLSFDYERRPGTDKAASTKLARGAIADVEGAALSARSNRTPHVQPEQPIRSGARTLGIGITAELVNKGRADLRGQEVKNPEDVARVAQVFRDPRFETMRIIYTKGDKIVAHEGVTSRMPGAALAFKRGRASRDLQDMRERMARLGADGYYLLHNHPSGKAEPSNEDVNLSTFYQHGEMDAKGRTVVSGVPGFKGHVVIDSGEYAVIAPSFFGRGSQVPVSKLDISPDKLLTPSVPHDFLDRLLNTPAKIAEIGKQMQAPEGFVTVLYTDVKHNLRAIQEVPRALLLRPKEGADFLRGQRRAFGAGNSVIYSATGDFAIKQAALDLFRSGDIFEYVDSADPHGNPYYSAHEQASHFGRARETVPQPRRVAEDKPDYNDDLFASLKKEFGIEDLPHHSEFQERDKGKFAGAPEYPERDPRAEKERALPRTLEEAGMRGGENRTYLPDTERGWMDAAHKTLHEKGMTGTGEFLKGLRGKELTGDNVATGVLYLNTIETELKTATGDTADKLAQAAVDVANVLSERLTKAGQQIRAVQVVNRLSPERQLLVAERKAEKVLGRSLTPQEGAQILHVARQLQEAENKVGELEGEIAALAKLKRRPAPKAPAPKIKRPGNYRDHLKADAEAAVARITATTGRAHFEVKEPSAKYGVKQTNTPEFKKWFGDSKVVDEKGEPLVVYHGTSANAFKVFDTSEEGAHFGTEEQANEAARREGGRGGRRKLIPAYLRIDNPLRTPDLGVWSNFNNVHGFLSSNKILTTKQADAVWAAWQQSDNQGWSSLKEALRKRDYDGIVYENGLEGEGDSYIAFEPTQIKSATGNRGTFDPNDPNILREPAADYGGSFDPLLDDYAAYGAHTMAQGMNRAEWEADMTEKFGKDLPLAEIGKRAYERVAEARSRAMKPGAEPKPKTAYRETGERIRAAEQVVKKAQEEADRATRIEARDEERAAKKAKREEEQATQRATRAEEQAVGREAKARIRAASIQAREARQQQVADAKQQAKAAAVQVRTERQTRLAEARQQLKDSQSAQKAAYQDFAEKTRETDRVAREKAVEQGRRDRDWRTPIREAATKARTTGANTVEDMVAVAAKELLAGPDPQTLRRKMIEEFGDDYKSNWQDVHKRANRIVNEARKSGEENKKLRSAMKEAGFEGDVGTLEGEARAKVTKLLEQRKAALKERTRQRMAMASDMGKLDHTWLNTADSVLKADLLAGLGPYSHKVGSLLTSTVAREARDIGAGLMDALWSRATDTPRALAVDLSGLARAVFQIRGAKEAGQILRTGESERGLERGESGFGRPVEEHIELPATNPIITATNQVFRTYKAGAHLFGTEAYERTKGQVAKALAINEAKRGVISADDIATRAEEIRNGDSITAEQQREMELAALQAYTDAIFQGDNSLNDFMKRLRRPGTSNTRPARLWTFFVNRKIPFMKSASNVLLRTLDYAGVGPHGALAETFKAGYEKARHGEAFKNDKQRRDFMRAWGALPVGISLMLLGAYLHKKGMLTSFLYEKNDNPQPGSVRIAHKLIDIGRYSPPGMLIGMGATIHELWGRKHKNKQGDETQTSFPEALAIGFGEMLSHLPLVQVGNLADELKHPKEGAKKEAGSVLTAFEPAFLHEAYKGYEGAIRAKAPTINPIVEALGANPAAELGPDKGYFGQVLRIREEPGESLKSMKARAEKLREGGKPDAALESQVEAAETKHKLAAADTKGKKRGDDFNSADRKPVHDELQRLGVTVTYPSNKIKLGDKEQKIPAARFEEFQREFLARQYAQLADMISKPVYQRMSDDDRRLAIEDFKNAWSDNERRRLHAQLVLDAGTTGNDRVTANDDLIKSKMKENELQNKDYFIQNRQMQRKLKPRSEISVPPQ